MTLHLLKLCVGTDSIEGLANWQCQRMAESPEAGRRRKLFHTTFQTPKRQSELLDGGSLFWVIRGVILARQRLTGFDTGNKDDGSPCCLLMLDPKLVAVHPVPRRAFQGWRYLSADDAPADLKGGAGNQIAAMPPRLRKELSELGLL